MAKQRPPQVIIEDKGSGPPSWVLVVLLLTVSGAVTALAVALLQITTALSALIILFGSGLLVSALATGIADIIRAVGEARAAQIAAKGQAKAAEIRAVRAPRRPSLPSDIPPTLLDDSFMVGKPITVGNVNRKPGVKS